MRLLFTARAAVRSLRRRPLFSLLNAAVLAIGIAGVTTIAALVGGLMRPLPYADAERLVFVVGGDASGGTGLLSAAELQAVVAQARSLEDVAALAEDVAPVGTGAEARARRGLRVSMAFARVMGARPRLGRLLAEADAGQQGVLLSEWFWRRELGGRPDVVGQTLVVDSRPATVVGVLDAGSALRPMLGFEPAWWRLLPQEPETGASLLALGRLRPGVTLAAAQAELDVLGKRLAGAGGEAGRVLRATPVAATIDPIAKVLVTLALAAILGIVCLDVGSVLLASALARSRELAIRQALGAGRRQLSALLLGEGLLLGLAGGVLALPLTLAAARLLAALTIGTNAEAMTVELDGTLFATALGVSLLAGALAGLAPALQWRLAEPASLLNEGAHTATASRRAGRTRSMLVAAQVAVSLALLTQASLALSSLRALLTLDRGFSARGVLALPLVADTGHRLGRELLERVAAVPGIETVVYASALPAEAPLEPYRLGDRPAGQARVASVSAGYFEALGVTLQAGRPFETESAAGPVAVVNDVLARAQGGPAVLGATVEVGGVRRVVTGVVAATRNPPLQVRPRPEIYVPWEDSKASSGWLLARTRFALPLRAATPLIAALDAEGSSHRSGGARPLDDALAVNMGVIRLGTGLLAAVALAALVLTSAGIFGVISFLVSRRTREIGIRVALGAGRGGILRLVLWQGLRPVAAGVVVGAAASLALGRLLASRVHGLEPIEPALLGGAALLMVAALALASALPARRATSVDPVTALRAE